MMKQEELLERINNLDYITFLNMSLEVLATLTNNFEEFLVTKLVTRFETNETQREVIRAIKKGYEKMRKDDPFSYWDLMGREYPGFMKRMELDIECGKVIKDEEEEQREFNEKIESHTITKEEIDEICSDDNAPTDTSSGEKDEIIRRQQETINEQQKRIKELEDIVASSSGGEVETKSDWIDWLDDDVFKPNFNAEKIAETIKVIVAPHLSTHCYWYVVFRVLDKIRWLADGVTQKAFLKWANAHFSYGWKGEQQFKFSEINDSIKRVADIDDWDKYTMKTNQGQYYAELRDKLYKVFVEKLPNGKLIDRKEFIKQGQLRVNNGH